MREFRWSWALCSLIFLSVACTPRVRTNVPGPREALQQRTGLVVGEGKPSSPLPPGVEWKPEITASEAVAIALWNNAQLQADLAGAGIAKANLVEAGLLRNPTFQILLPTGTKPFELFATWPVEQLWQRRYRVAAAEKAWEQTARGLEQNGLNTVRDTRVAHATLLQWQMRTEAARKSAELRTEIAGLTAARLRAGEIAELDLRLSEADAQSAREQLGRAEKETQMASERLRLLLGAAPERGTIRALEEPAHSAFADVDALREQAWAGRPDLRAQEIAIAAAAQRAKWERSRLFALAAALSTKRFLGRDMLTGPGVMVDAPLFRVNAGGVARADAEVQQAALQYAATRQRIDQEVSEAYARRSQAEQSLRDWEQKVMPALAAAVENAKSAYAKGDVSYLFVVESSRQWVDSESRRADLRTDLLRAEAELERSIGR